MLNLKYVRNAASGKQWTYLLGLSKVVFLKRINNYDNSVYLQSQVTRLLRKLFDPLFC